jgi:hypothetical protein
MLCLEFLNVFKLNRNYELRLKAFFLSFFLSFSLFLVLIPSTYSVYVQTVTVTPGHIQLHTNKHTHTHTHTRYDSSGRGIGPSQRPLPDNTQPSQQTDIYLTTHNPHNRQTSTWQHKTPPTDRHPCPHCDSNPYSQQASGRRTTP